jgi:signal transduction histidine kinase
MDKPQSQTAQWAALLLRLLAAAAAITLPLLDVSAGVVYDSNVLLLGGIVILVTNSLVVLGIIGRGLQDSLAVLQTVADWGTVGAVAYVVQGRPLPVLLAAVVIAVIGIGRTEWPWGVLAAYGTVLAAAVGVVFAYGGIVELLQPYWEVALVALVAVTFAALWAWADLSHRGQTTRQYNKVVDRLENELATIREGTRAVVSVATSLNTTSYQKILDAALDIGRLGLRRASNVRVVGMVLLVRDSDEQLQIVNNRGLAHYELDKLFAARSGVIGGAMAEGVAVIGGAGPKDPELAEMVAFARTRSTMAVPLRAEYINYGVLVFGTSDEDAFNSDTLDVVQTIATQVTVALQNASLYGNLLLEKERIVRLEQNARQALVRDLHDIPTQTISAVTMRTGILKMLLDRGQIDKLKPEIEAVEDMAKQATAEIRHVLFKLRPLALESQGLSVALAQLVEKTRKTFAQNVTLRIDEQVDHVLPMEAQDALFYLVEEAISNARKYAQAQMIKIDVAVKNDQVLVRVADNGVGFDVDAVQDKYVERGSFGMVNMHERAELIGGSLKLESRPGKGTAVLVTVPVGAAGGEGRLQYAVRQTKLGRTIQSPSV